MTGAGPRHAKISGKAINWVFVFFLIIDSASLNE